MKKLTYWVAMLAIAATTFTQTACKKDDDAFDSQTVQDNNSAESEFDDASSIEQDVMDNNESSLGGRSAASIETTYDDGVKVVIDNAAKTISIDFSPNGTPTTGQDGTQRKGIIKISYTARLREVGAVVTTTFDNYYVKRPAAVDFTKVEGTKTVTNKSVSNGIYTFERKVTNGKLTFPNAQTFTWAATRTIEWNSGGTYTYRWDDIFTQKTGSIASGTTRTGSTFSVNVDADVVVKTSCQKLRRFRPVSGKVTYTVGDGSPRVIDYGNGDCDNSFTVTVNGKVYTVTQN